MEQELQNRKRLLQARICGKKPRIMSIQCDTTSRASTAEICCADPAPETSLSCQKPQVARTPRRHTAVSQNRKPAIAAIKRLKPGPAGNFTLIRLLETQLNYLRLYLHQRHLTIGLGKCANGWRCLAHQGYYNSWSGVTPDSLEEIRRRKSCPLEVNE